MAIFFPFVTPVNAQTHGKQSAAGTWQVDTAPQSRNVLLEEFTGIHCGFCPKGHLIANTLTRATNQVIVVAVHAGHYAVPGYDEPDYRTEEGTAINDGFGITSYPSGTVNRVPYQSEGDVVLGRSSWTPAAKQIVEDIAPVNLYMQSTYSDKDRSLSVHVEGYLLADTLKDNLKLNVLWTQSNIIGPQNGANMGDEYVHRHMLRDYLSDVWGDTIVPAEGGKYFQQDYTVTLPTAINEVPVKPQDIQLVAFVTQDKRNVLNVIGQKPACPDLSLPIMAEVTAPDIPVGDTYGFNFFEVNLNSLTNVSIAKAAFDITVNGVTAESQWQGNVDAFGHATLRLPCTYAIEEGKNYDYSILLKSLNDETVESTPITGSFAAPIAATKSVILELATNKEANENTFVIRDAEGNTVHTFGPYAGGEKTETTESAELQAGKVYCFEITDAWGDGIYSPKGSYTLRSSDKKLIAQVFDIPDFGVRTFFITSREDTGIEGISSETGTAGTAMEVYNMYGVRIEATPDLSTLPQGTYILYERATGKSRKWMKGITR
ncbi:MAG: Omp28-related outer membrane protein [Prevotella sp.]